MVPSKWLSTRRWLVFLLGFSLFYLYSGGGPNQGTRFNLDRALLEQGSVTTDSYYTNSEDRAFHRGHYYCDKAPGASFAAIPVLALTRVFLRFTGVDPEGAQGLLLQMHVATWTASTLPTWLMCLLVFAWVKRWGGTRMAAVYAALALGLASPFWAYGTLFWGNALAAFCLVFAARGVVDAIYKPNAKRVVTPALLAGLATGLAVVTEFPTAPMAMALFVLLLAKLRPWCRHWQRLVAYAAGALAAACVLGVYNFVAFGSPFHLGYSSVEGFEGMKQGLFGVGWPRMEAISGVLWGQRGLLLTAPILVLGILGHVVSIVRGRNRLMSQLCLAFSFYPLLLNVSYVYWDGGWSYGPRHMSSALPFMALGLAPLYDALRPYARSVAVAALGGAVFMTMMAVAIHGMTPYEPSNSLLDLYWPSLVMGRFARHAGWTDSGGPATNLGLALGLSRANSLIPLWVGMGVGLSGLIRSLWPASASREGQQALPRLLP